MGLGACIKRLPILGKKRCDLLRVYVVVLSSGLCLDKSSTIGIGLGRFSDGFLDWLPIV